MTKDQPRNLSDIVEHINTTLKSLKTLKERFLPQTIDQLPVSTRNSILGQLEDIEERLEQELEDIASFQKQSSNKFEQLIIESKKDNKWLIVYLQHYLTSFWK